MAIEMPGYLILKLRISISAGMTTEFVHLYR